MQILQGIPVSHGVAIGESLVIDNEGVRILQRFVARQAVDHELERMATAFAAVEREIDYNRENVSRELGKQYGAIFAAHLQIVRDARMREEIASLIKQRNYSAEYAASRTLRHYAKTFEQLENARLAERADDLYDIEKRLLRNLMGHRRQELVHPLRPVVVLAHNLTPSETANLDPKLVLGFATEVGGLGSHTAIVAEAQGIAAVVGAGAFLQDVTGGETVIVDGDNGRVILQPDAETLAEYQAAIESKRVHAARLETLRDLPAATTDGAVIELSANVEFPHEIEACLQRGADGIGLYRTEFLYLISDEEPDEEKHFQAYARVVTTMAGKPVTIRTLDLGADKVRGLTAAVDEKNPFLGLRSIRLSLRNVPLFRTQLRAILRASSLGNVRVMFPLVSTLSELRQAKMLLSDVMEDLDEEGIAYNRNLPVGMMVEVPAAVVMLDRFAAEIDFFSIGTNDLIQYALAVDRSNLEVASLYNAADPAVLRLIEMTVIAARRGQAEVSLCGQMSGNPVYTMLLLGMGLRHLSVPPNSIPEIKQICRSVSIEQCEEVAGRALAMDTAVQIEAMLRDELRKASPDQTDHQSFHS